ncbi:hypothetical protein [Variovorax sp. GT1P44]|uniref:hypothetical protein n=1 Tax=Variovorax sp. GT1P44 TaxID=3443742 RepID=UPI003F476D3E
MTKELQLIVDQPSAGHFYWTIVDLNGHGDERTVVDYARGPLQTRAAAMVAGMTSLAQHQRSGIPPPQQMSSARFGRSADRAPGSLLHASMF